MFLKYFHALLDDYYCHRMDLLLTGFLSISDFQSVEILLPSPQPGTFGNVGRRFWLSQWRDAAAVQCGEARNGAKCLTVCPQYLVQNSSVAAVEKPCFKKELP